MVGSHRYITKDIFESLSNEGIMSYKHAKKTVSFLTITMPWGDERSILSLFKSLNSRILLSYPRSQISYIGTFVKQNDIFNNRIRYHAHIFWQKPYIPFSKLQYFWNRLIGEQNSNIRVTSVRIYPASLNRVIGYCLFQSVEHDPCDVFYYVSDFWGYVKQRESKKLISKRESIESDYGLTPQYTKITKKTRSSRKTQLQKVKDKYLKSDY